MAARPETVAVRKRVEPTGTVAEPPVTASATPSVVEEVTLTETMLDVSTAPLESVTRAVRLALEEAVVGVQAAE
jgi:hypothetical protein